MEGASAPPPAQRAGPPEKASLADFFQAPERSADDEGIQEEIGRQAEFAVLESAPDEPIPARGEPFKHQEVVLRLMLRLDRLLLIHEAGTGKTCSFGGVAEYYKDIFRFFREMPHFLSLEQVPIKRAYVLVRGGPLVTEFKKQIACVCRPGVYINAADERRMRFRGQLQHISKALSRQWYDIETYRHFYATYSGLSAKQLREKFSGCLFYVDEVHNLTFAPSKAMPPPHAGKAAIDEWAAKNRGEGGTVFQINNFLFRLFHGIDRAKVILGSATPMSNRPAEIIPVVNLIASDASVLPYQGELDFGQTVTAADGERLPMGRLFARAINGRVSFVRALETGAEPEYAGEYLTVEGVRMRTPIVVTTMGKVQTRAYEKVARGEHRGRRSESPRRGLDTAFDEVLEAGRPQKLRDNLFLRRRQTSTFVYPDGSLVAEGEKGAIDPRWASPMVIGEKKHGFYYEPTPEFREAVRHQPAVCSSKLAEIWDASARTQGCIFVYADWVVGAGAIMIGVYYRARGGVPVYDDGSGSFFPEPKLAFHMAKGEVSEVEGTALCGTNPGRRLSKRFLERRRLEEQEDPPPVLRYAVITSGTKEAERGAILSLAYSEQNLHGEYIKVLIGSRQLGEGVNLGNIIAVFVVSPPFDWREIYQAVRRALRAVSHRPLLQEREDWIWEAYQLWQAGGSVFLDRFLSEHRLPARLAESDAQAARRELGGAAKGALAEEFGAAWAARFAPLLVPGREEELGRALAKLRYFAAFSLEALAGAFEEAARAGPEEKSQRRALRPLTFLKVRISLYSAAPDASILERQIRAQRRRALEVADDEDAARALSEALDLPALINEEEGALRAEASELVKAWRGGNQKAARTITARLARKAENSAVDLSIYVRAEKKDRAIKAVMRLMMEHAADCVVNHSRNVKPSTLDGSAECEYASCDYTCDCGLKGVPAQLARANLDNPQLRLKVEDYIRGRLSAVAPLEIADVVDHFALYGRAPVEVAVMDFLASAPRVKDNLGFWRGVVRAGGCLLVEPGDVTGPDTARALMSWYALEDFLAHGSPLLKVISEAAPRLSVEKYLDLPAPRQVKDKVGSLPQFAQLFEYLSARHWKRGETHPATEPVMRMARKLFFRLNIPSAKVRKTENKFQKPAVKAGEMEKKPAFDDSPGHPVVYAHILGVLGMNRFQKRQGRFAMLSAVRNVALGSGIRVWFPETAPAEKPEEGWRNVTEDEFKAYNVALRKLLYWKVFRELDAREVYGVTVPHFEAGEDEEEEELLLVARQGKAKTERRSYGKICNSLTAKGSSKSSSVRPADVVAALYHVHTRLAPLPLKLLGRLSPAFRAYLAGLGEAEALVWHPYPPGEIGARRALVCGWDVDERLESEEGAGAFLRGNTLLNDETISDRLRSLAPARRKMRLDKETRRGYVEEAERWMAREDAEEMTDHRLAFSRALLENFDDFCNLAYCVLRQMGLLLRLLEFAPRPSGLNKCP